jgi:putative sporulation protein YyaC
MQFHLHVNDPDIGKVLPNQISEVIYEANHDNRTVVIVCVGTDRASGDALGPMIGTFLQEAGVPDVHGTLDYPIHATNLVQQMDFIRRAYHKPFIIAIDACLGQADMVEVIYVEDGPLRPGAGVNKELPAVGDMNIHANVNVGGFMENFILQNTRLATVYRLARAITEALQQSLKNIAKERVS